MQLIMTQDISDNNYNTINDKDATKATITIIKVTIIVQIDNTVIAILALLLLLPN